MSLPHAYWQAATKLELACVECNWDAAAKHLTELLSIRAEGWMRRTTIGGLERQRKARAGDAEIVAQLGKIIGSLQPIPK